MRKARFVLWKRPKGWDGDWTFRPGRYESKEAALDAIRNLDPSYDWMALMEGKIPQDNKKVGRRSVAGGEA